MEKARKAQQLELFRPSDIAKYSPARDNTLFMLAVGYFLAALVFSCVLLVLANCSGPNNRTDLDLGVKLKTDQAGNSAVSTAPAPSTLRNSDSAAPVTGKQN